MFLLAKYEVCFLCATFKDLGEAFFNDFNVFRANCEPSVSSRDIQLMSVRKIGRLKRPTEDQKYFDSKNCLVMTFKTSKRSQKVKTNKKTWK